MVMAASGLLLNFYLAGFVSEVALGVFNQIYAAYVIAAQVAVFGLQESAQRHVARHYHDPREQAQVATVALVLAGTTGSCIAAIVIAIAPSIGDLTESREVGRGIWLAALGLPFFALNKVLFGNLNGHRRMSAFAAGQAARVIQILGLCVWIGENGYAYSFFGLAFAVSELLLFPCLATAVGWSNLYQGLAREGGGGWWRRHFTFGFRSLPSGVLAEMFIRIDILMLGIYLDDGQVGKYSFAALFLEGLYQIPVVIRTIVNPMLARAEFSDTGKFRHMIRQVSALAGGATSLSGIILLFVFPSFVTLFPAALIEDSFLPLKILLLGLMAYAFFIPFDFLLLQSGRPGAQSLMMGVNVCANIVLNAALIPHFGIVGAAIATSASFIISALTLNLAAWLLLEMRGGILFARQFPRIVD